MDRYTKFGGDLLARSTGGQPTYDSQNGGSPREKPQQIDFVLVLNSACHEASLGIRDRTWCTVKRSKLYTSSSGYATLSNAVGGISSSHPSSKASAIDPRDTVLLCASYIAPHSSRAAKQSI
jgi:hypothetical protein